jgi:hypothetical protein
MGDGISPVVQIVKEILALFVPKIQVPHILPE